MADLTPLFQVTPLVSIVLPTRDRPEVFLRALNSILSQTERDFEVLVVDNNRRCPALRQGDGGLADPRVRLISGARATNAASARNAGLAAATGRWATYLDDDDEYRPEKLGRQLALAERTRSPLVLCGAEVRLRGRVRRLQVDVDRFAGDALLNEARWNTPMLLHRRVPDLGFDETLGAGEDAHFAHRLLVHWNLAAVPNAPEPLLTVYQDSGDEARTNIRAGAGWAAARRIWWEQRDRYSAGARRLFHLRARIARLKLEGRAGPCLRWSLRLLKKGGAGQARFAANALAVALFGGRGRFVS